MLQKGLPGKPATRGLRCLGAVTLVLLDMFGPRVHFIFCSHFFIKTVDQPQDGTHTQIRTLALMIFGSVNYLCLADKLVSIIGLLKLCFNIFLWLLFLSLSFFQASPELTETSQDRWFPKEGNSCVLVPGQGQSSVQSLYPGRTQTRVSGSARPGHSGPSNEFLTARNIPPNHNRRGRVSPTNLLQCNSFK